MKDDMMFTFMDAFLYAMEGENPSKAIENQEKRGQQSVIENQRLPKQLNDGSVPREIKWNGITDSMDYEEENKIKTLNNIDYTKKQYEKLGIVIIDEYNDLFWNVKLPEGWEIRATDHSMWNNLFDNKGRKRAEFFYKAASYDRDAFIDFETRYHINVDHVADENSSYDIWKNSDYQGTITDGDKIIFSTECIPVTGSYEDDDKVQAMLKEQLEQYMVNHYPNYKDINAYWD